MSNKRLTNEERAEIYRLWKEEGLTYKVIAERCSVNIATVCNVIKKMNSVQGMLDTLSNEPERIEQAAEPVVMTDERTAEPVPDAVLKAVADKIEALSEILSDNLLTVKKLQQDNEQIRSELAVLYGWRAEHEGTEN